jgi:hypothetical protein
MYETELHNKLLLHTKLRSANVIEKYVEQMMKLQNHMLHKPPGISVTNPSEQTC